jgi:hypothetical protein
VDNNHARHYLLWYKETVMPKKKVIAARNLKDCLPSLPLKTGKAKKEKQSFFIATLLWFPEVAYGLID